MDKNRVVNMEEYFDLTIEDFNPFKGNGNGAITSVVGLAAWLSENPEKTSTYYEGMWLMQMLNTGKFGLGQEFNYQVGTSISYEV